MIEADCLELNASKSIAPIPLAASILVLACRPAAYTC